MGRKRHSYRQDSIVLNITDVQQTARLDVNPQKSVRLRSAAASVPSSK
jgi:hypothetical protein